MDIEAYEAVEDLANQNLLVRGEPPYGVAQQVVYMGYESLTPTQCAIYDRDVAPLLKMREQELERFRGRAVMRAAG